MPDNGDPSFGSEIAPIRKAVSWAAYLGVAVLAVASISEEIRRMLSGPVDVLQWLHIGLFCSVLVLGGLWIVSGLNELGYAARWFSVRGGYVPPSTIEITGTIAAIGVVIGLLAVLSAWIFRYLVVYIVYLVLDLVWWVVRRRHYSKAISATRSVATSATALEAVSSIERYYMGRPHLRRCWVLIALSVALLLLVIGFTLVPLRSRQIVGYVGAIALFVGSEVPIEIWRYRLATELDSLKARSYADDGGQRT
jgi:hypothetical protein